MPYGNIGALLYSFVHFHAPYFVQFDIKVKITMAFFFSGILISFFFVMFLYLYKYTHIKQTFQILFGLQDFFRRCFFSLDCLLKHKEKGFNLLHQDSIDCS